MRAFGTFGVTSSGGYYTVDTGAGLVFKVNQSSGDITSLQCNGTEYQATDKNSQIASGLGSATVTATTYGNSYIKIACATDVTNGVVSSLTHYLIVKNGDSTIYMATYATAEPNVGELRWITRLQSSKVTNGPAPSDNRGNSGAIESTDVFGMPDGTTRSKYYGDETSHGKDRAMDLTYCGASGAGMGVWMIFDNPRESSSGGPFYRDIENQCGTDQEVYNYMNSGHEQTEAYRTNVLYGPYALVFTEGTPPTLPLDYSWMETGGLNLAGWVSATNRGAVTGVAWGIPAGFQGVVGFANTNAQYWAVVSSNGTYATPLMKPGVYTAVLYKGELAVATNPVTVDAGQTNTLNLGSGESAPSYIFKIGEWDGTPSGFLNASNIPVMHPSDVRNASWGPVTYTVGSSSPDSFPAIQFRGTNSPTTINFNLAQPTALTMRIGITCAYNNGRPQIAVNGAALSYPGPSSQPSSRSFTVGTYRGNNTTFTYSISSSHLVPGQNSITINPVSGNADLGPWLSAGWVYDAVELDIPNTGATAPAAPSGLSATPANGSQINLGWTGHSTNEINFLIERSPDNVTFALVGAVTAGVSNFGDTGLAPGTTYYYRVRASNSGGNSAYAGVASAATTLPRIAGISLSAAGVVLSGAGGIPNGNYYLLTWTNLARPTASWTRLATNRFAADGSFRATNVFEQTIVQRFYRLQLP